MNVRKTCVVIVLALLGISGLSGCIGAPTPDFEVPKTWQGREGSSIAQVRLDEQGKAVLVDFPEGVTRTDSDGYACLQTAGSLYSGEATWRALDPWAIELRFSDSVVTISSAQAKVGSQDWSEVRWKDCDSRVITFLSATG